MNRKDMNGLEKYTETLGDLLHVVMHPQPNGFCSNLDSYDDVIDYIRESLKQLNNDKQKEIEAARVILNGHLDERCKKFKTSIESNPDLCPVGLRFEYLDNKFIVTEHKNELKVIYPDVDIVNAIVDEIGLEQYNMLDNTKTISYDSCVVAEYFFEGKFIEKTFSFELVGSLNNLGW